MSLDYRKNTYKPKRPDTRTITSYGNMNAWISRQDAAPQPRPHVSGVLVERDNASPKFTKKRPLLKPSPAGMPTMYDTYVNKSSAILDETLPAHARYTQHCGYDDYHKAFRSIGDKHPELSFPHFGPPRLRHGRQGGSWRHVRNVLQHGGNRAVFVDGQVSTDDFLKIDSIPGGHLVLPEASARGYLSPRGCPSPRLTQQMNRLNDNAAGLIHVGRRSPRLQHVPVPRPAGLSKYHRFMDDDGGRKNWHDTVTEWTGLRAEDMPRVYG